MKLVLFDGLNLIRRLYAAVADQEMAIESTLARATSIIHETMENVRGTHLLLVMEGQYKTWRHQLWVDYKKGRSPMPADLQKNLPSLIEKMATNGIPNIAVAPWEADDIIATIARKSSVRSIECIIVSTDKGFSQLVDSNISIRNHFDHVTLNEDDVRGKWGLEPGQLVDFWAMTGDSTNNLPGIPGIGPKGAASILEEAGSLDQALAFPDQVAAKYRDLLTEHWQLAIITRVLARLRCDVPIHHNLHEFRYSVEK